MLGAPHPQTVFAKARQVRTEQGARPHLAIVNLHEAGAELRLGGSAARIRELLDNARPVPVVAQAAESRPGLARSGKAVKYRLEAPAPLGHTVGVASSESASISTVGEIMTRSPTALALDATVLDARRTMLDHGVSALPIIDSQARPVGIVTKTDLVSSMADDVPVAVLMANQVLTCTEDTSVHQAARTMRTSHVHHLVVVDGQRMVGILSVFDLLDVFGSTGPAEPDPA